MLQQSGSFLRMLPTPFCHARLGMLALLLSGLGQAAASPASDQVARRVRAHDTFLADDLMEGRGTGTRGYDLAALYVAAQFRRLGLEPGADGGVYRQEIAFVETTISVEGGRLVVKAAGKEDALAAVNDMVVAVSAGQTSAEVTAPAVFVGYGVHAPELNYDDFAGVDLHGKIAVILSGSPARFPSEQRAHHAQTDQKRSLLVRAGAVGVVTIITPSDLARRPWALTVSGSRFPAMRLLDSAGKIVEGFPELQAGAMVSATSATRIFAAAPHPLAEAFAAAERSEPQSYPLNASLTLAGTATVRTIKSANVLGLLPGTDPALADEPVVLTAHLDHIGIGPAFNGDTIYNGAMDNGMGSSILLAVAEELSAGPRLRHPVLFAAVTGEEKGLLGSRYLAAHPPAAVRRFAANVNMDMPLFFGAARDVIAFGAEHSTLREVLAMVAARYGLEVSPDPMPEENIFVRSDQYPFVLQGVPAICLTPGVKSVDPKIDLAAAGANFRKNHYHRPSDDLTLPIDWAATGPFALLLTDLTREIANNPKDPTWIQGDFFGERFGASRK